MPRSPWKERDPLFRGDDASGPSVPDPRAHPSVVAHILYDAWQVAQAANYVEQWSEHLLDWGGLPAARIAEAVGRAFRKRA